MHSRQNSINNLNLTVSCAFSEYVKRFFGNYHAFMPILFFFYFCTHAVFNLNWRLVNGFAEFFFYKNIVGYGGLFSMYSHLIYVYHEVVCLSKCRTAMKWAKINSFSIHRQRSWRFFHRCEFFNNIWFISSRNRLKKQVNFCLAINNFGNVP